MKTKHQLGHINRTVVKLSLIVSALALPLATQAGAPPAKPHARYKFIDLGTLGGPSSTVEFLIKSVNNHGTVVGAADTAVPDPFAPDCFRIGVPHKKKKFRV